MRIHTLVHNQKEESDVCTLWCAKVYLWIVCEWRNDFLPVLKSSSLTVDIIAVQVTCSWKLCMYMCVNNVQVPWRKFRQENRFTKNMDAFLKSKNGWL